MQVQAGNIARFKLKQSNSSFEEVFNWKKNGETLHTKSGVQGDFLKKLAGFFALRWGFGSHGNGLAGELYFGSRDCERASTLAFEKCGNARA